jgi:hypothetical protein
MRHGYSAVSMWIPLPKGVDAEVYLWVRQSELSSGLDGHLFQTVKDWMRQEWPFEQIAYPGRETTWEEWDAKPER